MDPQVVKHSVYITFLLKSDQRLQCLLLLNNITFCQAKAISEILLNVLKGSFEDDITLMLKRNHSLMLSISRPSFTLKQKRNSIINSSGKVYLLLKKLSPHILDLLDYFES